MSESENTKSVKDPGPSVEAIEATRERVTPYITAAAEAGMHFRTITGLMVRLGESLGIDIDAIGSQTFGAKDDDGIPDDKFYDEMMKACWLLCADESALIDAEEEGGKAVQRAFRAWQLKTFTTTEVEFLAMKAFLARWFEWRLESAEALASKSEPITE